LFQVNYAEQRSNYFQPSGRRLNGYVGAIEGTLYSDYVEISGDCAAKFKLYPAGDGWAYWQTDAGTWLSITRSGWLFSNSDSTRKVAWKIVDGHLYNLYWDKDNWKKYPAGGKLDFAVWLQKDTRYFVGVGLDDKYTLTNCELKPVQ
jgi:hypothetical protein